MPAGNRRLPRTMRNAMPSIIHNLTTDATTTRYAPLGAAVPTLQTLEQPPTPKHFPFPNLPFEDELHYELLMFFYTTLATIFQFIHLYRTVWWLPNSFTNQTLNFYLIDPILVVFILVILSRRLIYIGGCKLLDKLFPERLHESVHFFLRLFLFGFLSGLLSGFAYYIIQNHPIVYICYLCYPVLVYLIFFGMKITPFFELVNWNTTMPPLHACHSNPGNIRQEVEMLKIDFNNRMKQVLFSSVMNAYYAGFIPCCFAQNYLYYDTIWATQHVIFIFLASFISYISHIFSLRYCDILHRSALHLGNWDKLETRNMVPNSIWNEDVLWPLGALVRHGRDLYRAQGECNASEPGNAAFSRFYVTFKNPTTPLCILTTFHVFLIVFQLVVLFRTTIWYKLLSLSFTMFFNYYMLYRLAKDYMISDKTYKDELMIHNKINLR